MTESKPAAEVDMREVRRWAMICHLVALVGLLGNGLGFLIAPLIVWLLKRDEHPLIDEQGKESVNFQITMFLAILVGVLLALVLIGFAIIAVAVILMIALPIVAAVKTSNGESYRYPLTIRFVK
jgi:uncharacterized Tic20 family protein